MRQTLTRPRITIFVAAGVVALDQLTKAWVQRALADGPFEGLSPVLVFELGSNTGAAFGLFRGAGSLLGLIALVAVGLILYVARSSPRPVDLVGLGLILGGTLGNLTDRIVRGDGFLDGAVIDWVQLPRFPTFNVADAAITIGAALLIVGAIRRS